LGEHRSDPLAWRTGYGGLVATLVQRGGRDHLEVRLSVRLPGGSVRARDVARVIAASVDLVVRAVLTSARGGYPRVR
jgi:hypothetical protein